MCKDLLSSVVETDFFELINYSVLSEEALGVMRVARRDFQEDLLWPTEYKRETGGVEIDYQRGGL